MNYPELKIDEEKCIHCGLCVKDCVDRCLELNEDTKIPQFKKYKEGACIKCQHCLAVCPQGALSIWGKNPVNSEAVGNVNAEDLFKLIKSRRSVRLYKQENLDKSRMDKLKNMLKYVPTGVNDHRLHFSIVDDIEVMDDIRNKMTPKLIKLLENKIVKTTNPHFASLAKPLKQGIDIIFRGAPHLIAVSTPTDAPCKNIDPAIALSYFELYAQSLGVGTVWCGFADGVFRVLPELCDYIGIPRGYKLGYIMLFGVPDVKYSRTTQPEELTVQSVPLGGITKSTAFSKTKHYINNFLR